MDRINVVLTAVCGGVIAVLVAIIQTIRLKKQKIEHQLEAEKNKAEDAEKSLDQQKRIVEVYGDALSERDEIQQKISEKERKLTAEKKEAQTSEEPIKKSISVGNDIVGGFNSSK